MSKHKKNNNHHKYLNDLGISSTELCIFNTRETDNGKETGREKRFKKQREKYGFDERETWAMDYTLITWLYSHLKWYKNHAPINFEFHHFDIPVLEDIPEDEIEWNEARTYAPAFQKEVIKKDVSQKDAMKLALKYMKYFLKKEDDEEDDFKAAAEIETRRFECAKCSLKIVAELFPALWW